jgi:hypothetical protein
LDCARVLAAFQGPAFQQRGSSSLPATLPDAKVFKLPHWSLGKPPSHPTLRENRAAQALMPPLR